MKNIRFRKPLLFLALLGPLGYLTYLIWRYSEGDPAALGADPGKEIMLFMGEWTLLMLMATLSLTPLQNLLKVKLVRFRRMLGLFAFFYASLHLSAYLVFLLEFEFSGLWADVLKRPYITVGFTALLGMVPLAITSNRGMQRRLGRNWKRLHRLIYPIAILAIIHFIWQTRSDFTEPLMYSAALALLLTLRVVKRARNRSVPKPS
jgi:sulfoxide reductase heme-binding subunit YedZ